MRTVLLSAILLVQTLCHATAADRAFTWPNGARAAVNLAYDDALDSQLDRAIPALDRYKLKGTFYLQLSSPVVGARLAGWRAAAQAGHELANHTLFHHCAASKPDRGWVLPERDLDKITVAELKDQIKLANVMLHAIDGKRERTFTTPCGDLEAGGVNYLAAVKDEFIGMKTRFGGVIPSMEGFDVHAVQVMGPSGVSGAELIAAVEEAVRKGTMANFTFHGIGGDHLSITTEAHDELLAYLAKHRKTIWTDTFLKQMKYVKAQQAARNLP